MYTRLFYTRLWRWLGGLVVMGCLGSLLAGGWQEPWVGAPPGPATDEGLAESQEPLVPLPLHVAADPPRVALGERLFHDVRLSGRNTIACATCHRLEYGGAD